MKNNVKQEEFAKVLSYPLYGNIIFYHRAHKICSDRTLLSAESNNILQFMSWNGFRKPYPIKLIKQMTPNSDLTQGDSDQKDNQQLPKVYIRLPYIGKPGTDFIRNFRSKMLRHLNTLCNITSFFVSCKDKIPKEFQSSIIYKFSCPGCSKSYIGKTNRYLKSGLLVIT